MLVQRLVFGMGAETKRATRQLFIDGEWVATEAFLEVMNPATGTIAGRVAAGAPDHAEAALAAANAATRRMRETTIVQRARWLEAIADGLLEREDELAETIVHEAGKPVTSARGEVRAAAERFRRGAEEARSLRGEFLEGSTRGHEGWQAIVKPQPVGTVLCITPYNYPLSTTALHVAPALAAGNSVVVKPASETPVSAVILTDVIANIDLPDGAFNLVTGRSRDIGDVLASDDRVDAIAMTGSSAAGKRVAQQSGMVRLHLELGGNAPAVIFPDADLAVAAAACARGALKYAGQRCSAISRVLAHDSVHDELVGAIDERMDNWVQGDLFDGDTDLGPLISEQQAEWVTELVVDAIDSGATLVRGGHRFTSADELQGVSDAPAESISDDEGRWFEPTLLADVPAEARIVNEEQFGPVVSVTPFTEEAHALDMINGSDLGLDACVFTDDYDRALSLSDRIEAGAVSINRPPSHGIGDIPFGGTKDSGIGREGIGYSIEAFTTTKSVVL